MSNIKLKLDLIFLGLSMLCFGVAILSTPVAIFYGLHEWVVDDAEFKHALFDGFKLWLKMIACGLIGGATFYFLGKD